MAARLGTLFSDFTAERFEGLHHLNRPTRPSRIESA